MKLSNGEIHSAYQSLVELGQVKLPVKTSLDVAKLANKLESAFKVIGSEVDKLIKQYGEVDKETGRVGIKAGSPNMEKYLKDQEVVLAPEWDEDFTITKVKLPEKVAGTCDKCSHNLDVKFLIEPTILMPLAEKFVEVV